MLLTLPMLQTAYAAVEVGKFDEALPIYSLTDVAKHKTLEDRVWVTYRDGVYDITDFVKMHPGGKRILKASGRSVERYWKVYRKHNKPYVRELLERYRIGNLKKKQ